MALGFKKPSSGTLENLGMLGGVGLAALGGPIAPLILASLYSTQQSGKRAQKKEDIDEYERQALASGQMPAGVDPRDPMGVNWEQSRPTSEQEDRALLARQAPEFMMKQRVAQMFPEPETFGEAKEVDGGFAAFGNRGGVRRFEGVAPASRPEPIEMVNVFDLRANRPMGAINKRAFDRLTTEQPGRFQVMGNEVPTQTPSGTRPATAQEKAAYGIPETAGVAINLSDGRPIILTQPKQDAPTEGQSNAAYNAGRVSDALMSVSKILETDPGASTSAALEGTEGIPFIAPLGRMVASPNQEVFRNNMADAVDAIITLGTGAAYTGEQKTAARNAYLPQIGDSAEAKADKYRKLISVYGVAREKARAAGKDLPDPSVFSAVFTPKQGGAPKTGGRVLIQNGSRFDEQGNYLGPVGK